MSSPDASEALAEELEAVEAILMDGIEADVGGEVKTVRKCDRTKQIDK